MSATAALAPEGTQPRRRLVAQLWFWVLVAIAAGIVFGLVAPDQAKKAKWLPDAFIQLLKTVTGPVIFVTVVIGIASLGNLARAGGLALRALAYFFCATVVALTLGLLAANIVQPGSGFHGSASAAGREAAKESIGEAGQDSGVVSFITGHLLPTSFLQPFVDNEILQVLVLAILTAAAVSMPPGARPGDPRGRGRLDAPGVAARADRARLRGRLAGDLRDHPADHVGRADRRVRRHGLHRRGVRQRVASEPGAAHGRVLGNVRDLRLRRARDRRADERLQHLQDGAAHQGAAADHPLHP